MPRRPRPDIEEIVRLSDELFMNDRERKEVKLPRIFKIPINLIDEFPGHPFQVRMDEDMEQLIESVKERGVITPVTLRRKEDDRYEIVSGHRRTKACELAGLEYVPAEVKKLTRDEAILLMVDSNLQRSTILPSEKAFAYKMKLEALKRQGQRTDLTSDPVGPKSGQRSNEMVAEQVGDSKTQVQRYIRLTYLEPEILALVDEGKIGLRPAVELSYLNDIEQQDLIPLMEEAEATPSHAQTIKMRNFSKEGKLTPEVLESIMMEEKPNQKEKITIRMEDARRYIPNSIPLNKAGEYVMKALEYYHRHLERQRDAR